MHLLETSLFFTLAVLVSAISAEPLDESSSSVTVQQFDAMRDAMEGLRREMAILKEEKNAQAPKPMFTVTKTSSLVGSGGPNFKTLVFDTAITNTPTGSYNTKTGIFTAPLQGYYLFTAACSSSADRNAFIRLVVNGGTVTEGLDQGEGISACVVNAVVYMDQGSHASIVWNDDRQDGIRSNQCTFTGIWQDYA